MSIQSLSVVVPNKRCINGCKFCVSRMRDEQYENMTSKKNIYLNLYKKDYKDRLTYARDNGCQAIMLTGNSEPQQNREFLDFFAEMNQGIGNPFRRIDMQTTGVLLDDDYLYYLRHNVGVNTISLSISSFNDEKNQEYGDLYELVRIKHLCTRIKQYRFNLRISINLTDTFNHSSPEFIFDYVNMLGADQVTFRVLYADGDNEQSQWVSEHGADSELIKRINAYIKDEGKLLYETQYGQKVYSVDGLSTLLDDDCMSKENKRDIKYLILRENCKLYSQWDDKGSLIF